jgi:hypothetical protein
MPWTEDVYPPAMQGLDPLVRRKAIEIANALLAEHHEEGFVIRVAIARAKQWARGAGGSSPPRASATSSSPVHETAKTGCIDRADAESPRRGQLPTRRFADDERVRATRDGGGHSSPPAPRSGLALPHGS